MRNLEIRKKLKENGVKQWELAEALGVHETTLCTRLRKELKENEAKKIMNIIDELSEKGV